SGRIGWMVGVVACLTFPWGCGLSPANTLPSGARPMVGPSPSVAPPVSSNQYRIGPEDVLDIVVWKNADLSKSVTVRPDGMVTLPLIGELRAGGLTADQVRDDIKVRLARYKEVPEVSVTVTDVRSYNLYILGEVKTPGRYQVKSYTSLLQALALAGGFTPWAETEGIVVVRRDKGVKEQRMNVRYKDLVKRGDFGLSPGDTVIVP
ncbi:MAG: polysaccharide biosynthesis/export family protein, partial [Nitrospiria bacterium]